VSLLIECEQFYTEIINGAASIKGEVKLRLLKVAEGYHSTKQTDAFRLIVD